ncbi:MAG: trypsin-like serine protease [Cyanobacteria bacterium REEB446]|nr:trypsin-like serine protease [Cyanobacteria bacterium REEB446]
MAISRSPQVIDEEGIVNRSAISASGVIHKIFKNVDGKDIIYILTAAHVHDVGRGSVVLPNGIVAKPESISEPENFNKTDIQVLRIAIPSDNKKNSELLALDIDEQNLKKQDPLLKAGFSRFGMQPVCGELESSSCLPKSLQTIKKAQALTVPAKFGDGSLFNSPLLVIDGTNVMELPSVKSPDATFSCNKEKLKKIPYFVTEKMAATPGDSGGPIISKNIQLVGLVSQGNTLDLNSNVSMPLLSYHRNEIRKIIDDDILDFRKNRMR